MKWAGDRKFGTCLSQAGLLKRSEDFWPTCTYFKISSLGCLLPAWIQHILLMWLLFMAAMPSRRKFAKTWQQPGRNFGELRGTSGKLRGNFGELRGTSGKLRGNFGELRGTSGKSCLAQQLLREHKSGAAEEVWHKTYTPSVFKPKKHTFRPNRLKLTLGPLSPHPGHPYAIRERNLTSVLSFDNCGPITSVCYPNDHCWKL